MCGHCSWTHSIARMKLTYDGILEYLGPLNVHLLLYFCVLSGWLPSPCSHRPVMSQEFLMNEKSPVIMLAKEAYGPF